LDQRIRTDLSEIIAESFGANATYVEGLLSRFRSNPELVDESWRAYFTELLSDSKVASQADGSDNGRGAAAPVNAQGTPAQAAAKITESAQTKAAVAPAPERKSVTAPPVAEPHAQATPIRGSALKIVENMEASLFRRQLRNVASR